MPRVAAVLACSSILLACGGPSVAIEAPLDAADAPRVRGAVAQRIVDDGAVLLDVRSGPEFLVRHVEGATNIPLPELESRATELDPRLPVVVVCTSGHRSAQAARLLRRAGFSRVYDAGSFLTYGGGRSREGRPIDPGGASWGVASSGQPWAQDW